MIRGFYSGAVGLKAQQTAVDTIANNIANVNTTGYKQKTEEFSDLLYSSMRTPQSNNSGMLAGSGATVSAIVGDMSQGGKVPTGNSMDYSVNKNGFFQVEDAGGNRFFTRDGSFTAAQDQGSYYLANQQGLFVLDAGGNRIAVGAGGAVQGKPGVFDFPNSSGLTPEGNNLYAQTALSGAPAVSDEGYITGYLEGSNVELASQMSDLIMTQRAYQLNSKVVQTADQIESMANELKQ